MMGQDPATAPRNDSPGNAAYQSMRDQLAEVTARELRGR